MPVNRNEITNGAMLSDALEQGMNTGELAARFDGAPCIMKRSIAGCFPYCAGKMIRPPGKFVGRKVCSGGRKGTSKPRWHGTGSIFPLSS